MITTHAERGWPPAIVAGAYQTGVLAVRGLMRRNVEAHLIDCDASFPGFKSRYRRALLCPDPDRDPSGWVDFMLAWARRLDREAVLMASSDAFVSAIARHEASLRPHFLFTSTAALHGLLADKHTQYAAAAANGMPMPVTREANCVDDVASFAQAATFPCLIKPTHFREWLKFDPDHRLYDRKLVIAQTPDELVNYYEAASSVTPHVILQEIILGDDSAKRVYVSCYGEDGRRLGHALFRALRCDPIGFGPASVTEPVVDAESAEVCDRFLRRIGYTGICEIEMKVDRRDGRAKLIEVNPRLSGGGDAAPYAGVQTAWLHYLDLIGHHVIEAFPAENADFRHIVLRADARAVPAYWAAGKLSWRELVRSYRAPRAYFDVDWGDWSYTVETLLVSLRSFLRGLLRGLFVRKLPE